MSNRSSRRDFLKQSAAAGIGAWAAANADAWGQAPATSPGEKVNIACIGVGGKGSSDTDHAGMHGNVVALCDVDEKFLDAKAQKFPSAKKFTDYRKMFDEMERDFDAVTVSTPDHTHAAAAMRAIKAGKHVYCQKPLTHTVAEARALREAAREHKVATQMGNHGTASDDFRRGVELLRSDVLGPVKEVHVWTNRPVWPQAPDVTTRPSESAAVPETLHWEQWIGPAPMRPYSPAYHPFKWRGWWDFGTGALGDMGCHTCNLPFMGLELGHPATISAVAGDLNPETYPGWATVIFEFPARGQRPPVKFVWWEGHKKDPKTGERNRNLPAKQVTQGFELPPSGSMMIGEKGSLLSFDDYGSGLHVILGPNAEGFAAPPISLPRIKGGDSQHKLEWINAIRGGPPAMSNFDYAGMLTEFILLGNVAIRAGTKIEWDGPGMRVTNMPEANAWLKSDYREGWTL